MSAATDLRATLRRLADQALELVQVRLALLGTELELEAQRLFAALLHGAAALLLFGVALLSGAALVVVLLWEQRLWVLAVLMLGCAGIGWWLLRRATAALRRDRLFGSSLDELARDRERLNARRPSDPSR